MTDVLQYLKNLRDSAKLLESMHWFRDDESIMSFAEAMCSHPKHVGFFCFKISIMPKCPHRQLLPVRRSDHRNMPSIVKIGRYWQDNSDLASQMFGERVGRVMAKSGSLCFGCTWPIAEDRAVWDDFEPTDSSWFERAHLQDCSLGGVNESENLVPLCSPCHWRMTNNFSGCRDCAAKWIRWLNSSGEYEELLSNENTDRWIMSYSMEGYDDLFGIGPEESVHDMDAEHYGPSGDKVVQVRIAGAGKRTYAYAIPRDLDVALGDWVVLPGNVVSEGGGIGYVASFGRDGYDGPLKEITGKTGKPDEFMLRMLLAKTRDQAADIWDDAHRAGVTAERLAELAAAGARRLAERGIK